MPRLMANGVFAVSGVMLAALAFVASALDHVPEVRNHAGLDPALTVFVEIDAPGIARAFGEDFETMLRRVIAPHSGVHPLALAFRRARLADV